MGSDGLSKNHDKLSAEKQRIEHLTKLRRKEPLFKSEIESDCFYSSGQLRKKGPKHDLDMGFNSTNLTLDQISNRTFTASEQLLAQPPESVFRNETTILNKHERVDAIVDKDTRNLGLYEHNPEYNGKKYFISFYQMSDTAYEKFIKTGEIGLSNAEKQERIDTAIKSRKARFEQRKKEEQFYLNMPRKYQMNKKQLKIAEKLEVRKFNYSEVLNRKEQLTLERGQGHKNYKNEHFPTKNKENSTQDDN